jgi:two-component system LytT family sensor kinase
MRYRRAGVIFNHFLFWLVLVSVPPMSLRILELITGDEDIISPLILSYLVLMVGIFYFNAYFLLPRYLLRKKVVLYCVLVITVLLLVSGIYTWFQYLLRQLNGPVASSLIIYFFLGLIPIFLSTAYRIIDGNIREQRRKQEMENESIRSELSLLRSQVSPHFMFNVLNTLVALIRQRSEELEPVVMELSHLMRYMLYESDEEKVSLRTEIQYLESYINIQKIRFGSKVSIVFDHPQDLPEMMLEPMLLIPLVENAFKHGVNVIHEPAVIIGLRLNDGRLHVNISNRYKEPAPGRDNGSSGIGIANLRRRLNLLYPGAHELQLLKEDGWFNASLHINLNHEREDNSKLVSVFKIMT